ncbi:MAG: hypothetical protein AAGD25_31560 [Cyanobacteria bacterium P01_F01_bin.150]
MQSNEYLSILCKTGGVLVVIGICDIALMAYSLAMATSYAAHVHIFAIIAGFFLIRGNLKAASLIRSLSVFGIILLGGMFILALCSRPIGLTVTQLRLQPTVILGPAAFLLGSVTLLYWLQWQLGKKPVITAQLRKGLPKPEMRTPIFLGVLGLLAVAVLMGTLRNGESAQKAEDMARQQLGDAYNYHVSSIEIFRSGDVKEVSSVVTAWNPSEVQSLSIEWQE